MEYLKLKDLEEDNECWAIKLRVCRLWESLNSKKNGELISLDMVFIDEMGTLMATTIRRNLVSKFKHLLKEGLVYTVKNFKVVVNSGAYRVVNSKFKITFTLLTTIKREDNNTPSIRCTDFNILMRRRLTLGYKLHFVVKDDTDYNIKRGSDKFLVHNVFEPNENMEKSYLSTGRGKNDASLLDELDDEIEDQQSSVSISATKRRKIIIDDENESSGEFAGQRVPKNLSQMKFTRMMGKTRSFSKGYSYGFVPDYRHAVETMADIS
ncbi:protein of unknown function DUF223 [Cynara cardunculus var. scolymus]|uniref:Replication protein A 70 kDa DNA-binding subunit B/D first OB fold domain-containing protein n=1 Tax=Cynara cardunculus var. scolymus TaxID=59895 RepID=A0A118K2K6_CYNCS|nr:protein of unknown function DUF223 [Cynara cardunculus var. scolymus]